MSRGAKIARVREMILPTAPNQFGTVALVESDLERTWRYFKGFGTVGNQVYSIRQVYTQDVVYQAANQAVGDGLYFSLSRLTGVADLQTVFDQYRIRAVDVKIQPQFTSLTPVAGVYWPRLYTCIDYDDATPISLAAIRQYDTVVEAPAGTGLVRCIQPRAALAAYSGAFTSYANLTEQWFDIASPDVQHFGLKYVIEPGLALQTMLQGFNIDVTMYVQLRNAR